MNCPIVNRAASLAIVAFFAACSRKPTDVAPMTSSSPSAGPAGAAASTAHPVPTPRAYAAPPAKRVGVLAPGTGIAVGEHVPELAARDLSGKEVTLSSLYATGPILLAFYRGGWCPYCNMEIHQLTEGYPEFQKRGVTPVALSVDQPEAEALLKATYVIPFPVLSDIDAHVIEAFHVVNSVSPEDFATMKAKGVDLERYSGRTHHEIAIPSLFLIDRTGVVRWAHSDPDFKVRPATAQVLAAIDAVGVDHAAHDHGVNEVTPELASKVKAAIRTTN